MGKGCGEIWVNLGLTKAARANFAAIAPQFGNGNLRRLTPGRFCDRALAQPFAATTDD